jgi:hypothetical protein
MPKCKYCGGTEFYEGASGGMSTNIQCANQKCRHWFNWTPIIDELDDLGRVEPSDEEKTQLAKERDGSINLGLPRMLVKLDTIYEEGRRIHQRGGSARECMQEKAFGGYGAAESNMLRMCGWLDSLRDLSNRSRS